MNKKVKIAIGATVFLAGGLLVYKYMRDQKKAKAIGQADDALMDSKVPPVPVAPVPAKAVVPSSGFPLKKGSKGEKVKELQSALKVGVDGDFGSITEAALKAKTGLTSIADQAQLTVVLTKLKNLTLAQTDIDRANKLLADFNAFPTRQLRTTANSTGQKAYVDAYNAVHYIPNVTMTLNGGVTYNRQHFFLHHVTKQGKIIVNIQRGREDDGLYVFSPQTFTLTT